jgi:hypothetical protein
MASAFLNRSGPRSTEFDTPQFTKTGGNSVVTAGIVRGWFEPGYGLGDRQILHAEELFLIGPDLFDVESR